jgi:hypothetical protein
MAAKKKPLAPLKLYVWEGVLTDYTDGIIFALARSEKQARRLVGKSASYAENEIKDKKPDVYNRPIGFHLCGGG